MNHGLQPRLFLQAAVQLKPSRLFPFRVSPALKHYESKKRKKKSRNLQETFPETKTSSKRNNDL
jgi:hypothetical protein